MMEFSEDINTVGQYGFRNGLRYRKEEEDQFSDEEDEAENEEEEKVNARSII